MTKAMVDYQADYLGLLRSQGVAVVGIGVTAFNRIGPGLIYPDYQIVCHKWGTDLEELEKICKITSIQRDFPEEDIRRLNTLAILSHRGVQGYLKGLGKPVKIFVYRTTERVDELCAELGFEVLANKAEIRDKYENKKEFFEIGRKMGLPMIPGEQWEIDKLTEKEYGRVVERLGGKLVFQLTEYSRGGGSGTYFVSSLDDFLAFRASVKERRAERELTYVNLTRFVEGDSPSITGCATRYGVLTGPVQMQAIDIPELAKTDRKGVFRGHDWSYKHYEPWVQEQAQVIARRLGEHMYKDGYRGIFGVDLIVDWEKKKVYPVECNPRYTGAFPVYSMIQHEVGEVPLDVFQLLELMNVDYKMDFGAIDESWKGSKRGAHLVVSNPNLTEWARAQGDLKAGVYRLKDDDLERVGDGVTYGDVGSEDEFVLTDGCPRQGELVKPHLRAGKLIFKRSILEEPGMLNDFARTALKKVMEGLQLEVVSRQEQDKLNQEYGYD